MMQRVPLPDPRGPWSRRDSRRLDRAVVAYEALVGHAVGRRPSLALHLGDDGRLLWHCRAGCPQDAIREALADRGLLNGHARDFAPRRAPAASERPAAASAPPRAPEGMPDMRDGQKWEAGERRMHPAFWDLFRRRLAADEHVTG